MNNGHEMEEGVSEGLVSEVQAETTKWLFIAIRVALTIGALVFMWQLGNPKTT